MIGVVGAFALVAVTETLPGHGRVLLVGVLSVALGHGESSRMDVVAKRVGIVARLPDEIVCSVVEVEPDALDIEPLGYHLDAHLRRHGIAVIDRSEVWPAGRRQREAAR